MLIMY